MKSIMLKEKSCINVFCEPIESFCQSTNECVAIGNRKKGISEVLVRERDTNV